MKKKKQSDVVAILYKPVNDHLWGVIARFKHREGQGKVPPYLQSAPFVISRTIGSDRVVYGSVETLLLEIRLTVLDLVDENRKWEAAKASSESDYSYARRAKNGLLALAVEARNLDDLLLHRNLGEVQCFNYDDKPIGNVPIRKVLDYLVHNRYVYTDGTYIKDIFSDRSWSDMKVRKQFMGYGIQLTDLINGILALVDAVTIRDIIALLRKRLSRFRASNDNQDLILLIQNMYALTAWLSRRQPDRRYASILTEMCSPLAQGRLTQIDPKEVNGRLSIAFEFRGGASISTLKVAPEWTFGVVVQAKCCIRDSKGTLVYEDSDYQTYKADLSHDKFLGIIDRTFGYDTVVHSKERFGLSPGC